MNTPDPDAIRSRMEEGEIDVSPDIHSGAAFHDSAVLVAEAHVVDADLDRGTTPARRSRGTFSLYVRRFRRNKTAVAGMVIFILLALFAILGELIAPYDYLRTDFLSLTAPPGTNNHWWGTNNAGNDLFSQTAHGLRQSMLIALIVSIGSTALAAVVGASAAYFRGRTEQIILWVIHFLMIMPTFLILSLISNKAGGNWLVIALVMTAISWFMGARTVWAIALSVREQDYVAAARYMGVSGFRIVLRHIIPNIGSLLVISFTLGLVGAVMAETGLSFIGFGVKTPDVSLGSLIGSGSNTVTSAPWLFYFPAGVLTLLTVSMAFVADGLRDALDPTSNSGGTA